MTKYPRFADFLIGLVLKEMILELTFILLSAAPLQKFGQEKSAMSDSDGERCDKVREFDFIISGSGAAGALLANILSHNGKYSVFLGEAGGDNLDEIRLNEARFNRDIIAKWWNEFGWVGQSYNELKLANRNFLVPQTGLTLGGSTRVNNLNTVKASVTNLKQWEKLNGKFWSPNRFYNAYEQLERFWPAANTGSDDKRGTDGPIQVLQVPQSGPLQVGIDIANAANQALGLPIIKDYNSKKTPIGASATAQLFEYPDGTRSDSVTAFLNDDVMKRDRHNELNFLGTGRRKGKLVVSTLTRFQKFIYKGKKTVGAVFLQNGETFEVRARADVIICHGFLSAATLATQGIGPRAWLKKAGIDVVEDNPNLGNDNLANHVSVSWTLPKSPLKPATDPLNPGATTTCCTFHSDPNGFIDPNIRAVQIVYRDDVTSTSGIAPSIPNPAILNSTVFNMQPFSRGSETVKSRDIQQMPLVDYDYLENNLDLQFFISVFQKIVAPMMIRLNQNDPTYNIAAMNPSLATMQAATPADLATLTAYINANVRQNSHASSSVRMAPREQGGVVDKRCRVHGIEGLLVVDTSVLPFSPDANNCFTVWAAALMIGEWLYQRGNSRKKDKKCKK